MEKKRQGLHQRWERMYRRSSIQMILSLSFTAVAVIGMLFLGMALLFRFSSSASSMAADNTRRILTQVNLNLDRYLHNMMQVSDTVYYRVIKNADLSQQKGREELQDALELLYAKDRDVLVSLAIFEGDGSLVAATPLEDLKYSVSPHREDWFTSAMERILDLTNDAFENDDLTLARQVEPLEEVIDIMVEKLRDQHIKRLKDGICSIDTGVVFLDVLNNAERISDHCSNIAARLIGMDAGEDYDSHTLKSIMHHNPTKDYMLEYEECRKADLVPLEDMEA